MTKVVLIESVENVGRVGDVVRVRPGYARNFLFPQKKAVVADESSLKKIEHQKLVLDHRLKKVKLESEKVKEGLDKISFVIERKTSDQDKLFGSVTAMDIEQLLKSKNFTIGRRSIVLSSPIRKIGVYQVPVKLDGGFEAVIKLEVKAQATQEN